MDTCHVCGKPLDGVNQVVCYTCHRPFHLPTRVDSEVDPCGRMWMDPESLGLGFTCEPCAQGVGPPESPAMPPFPV